MAVSAGVALLCAGCAKSKTWGASCQMNSDCSEGFGCQLRYAAAPKEPHFCTKPCVQHEPEACPERWHCQPDPFSPRAGQCEPSFWPPP